MTLRLPPLASRLKTRPEWDSGVIISNGVYFLTGAGLAAISASAAAHYPAGADALAGPWPASDGRWM